MAERRVILVGKTGNGKSATGNSLLGYQAFVHRKSPSPVTKNCAINNGNNSIRRQSYKVCDTPGFLVTDISLLDQLLEVQKSMKICKMPRAFLLVYSSTTRWTEDEHHTIDLIRMMFGKEVFDHCIIVFTRGNEFNTDTKFETFLKDDNFSKLLEKCKGRVVRIENSKSNEGLNMQDDIIRVMDMINKVSECGKKVYQYTFLDSNVEVLKKYAEEHKDTKEKIATHIASIAEILAKEIKAEEAALAAKRAAIDAAHSVALRMQQPVQRCMSFPLPPLPRRPSWLPSSELPRRELPSSGPSLPLPPRPPNMKW